MTESELREADYQSPFTAQHFYNEEAAYAYIEAQLWGCVPKCPHCGSTGRIKQLKGKSHRRGVYTCYTCIKPFTVKVGTLFHGSRVPLRTWLKGIYLVVGTCDRLTAEDLIHVLGVSRGTAQYMLIRIRIALQWQVDRLGNSITSRNMESGTSGKVDTTPRTRLISGEASGAKRYQRFRL